MEETQEEERRGKEGAKYGDVPSELDRIEGDRHDQEGTGEEYEMEDRKGRSGQQRIEPGQQKAPGKGQQENSDGEHGECLHDRRQMPPLHGSHIALLGILQGGIGKGVVPIHQKDIDLLRDNGKGEEQEQRKGQKGLRGSANLPGRQDGRTGYDHGKHGIVGGDITSDGGPIHPQELHDGAYDQARLEIPERQARDRRNNDRP